MKTLVIVFAVLLVLGGAVPMALAQQDASSSSSSSASQPAPAAPSGAKTPDVSVKAPDAKVGVDIKSDSKTDVSRDTGGGSASPRTEATRTSFFGLSPTAAIIVSVAVLLVVILAIVAMTNSSNTTYIDKGDRL
jgi:hypothetical protein